MYCRDAARFVELYAASQVLSKFDTRIGHDILARKKLVLEKRSQPNGYSEDQVYELRPLSVASRRAWAGQVNNEANNAKWIPGDWGYIDNTDPNAASGQEGENVIYLGKDPGLNEGLFTLDNLEFRQNARFWGHVIAVGDRIRTLEQWFAFVESWSADYPAVIADRREALLEQSQ